MSLATLRQAPARSLDLPRAGLLVLGAAALPAGLVWVWSAPGYWLFTVTAGIILAISALGLMVAVGWTNEISLAQAGLTGTACYLCAWADRPGRGLGWPYLAAVALATAAVVGLSILVALGTARLAGIYVLVVTLALQSTLEVAVFTHRTATGRGMDFASTRPRLFGVGLHGDRAYLLFAAVVLGLVMLGLFRLRRTRFGRGLLLVGVDRQVAGSVGVSPWAARVGAFALAGAGAGIAGALTAPLYTTPPGSSGFSAFFSLFYVAVPVLAGFHSVAVVAAVAISFVVLPEALEAYRVSPFLLGGLSLLIGTLVGRNGISGLILNRVWSSRRREAAVTRSIQEQAAGTEAPERRAAHEQAIKVLEAYLPARRGQGDVLEVHDVSVRFGGVQALQQASLVLPAGQLVGLLGPNGAGKTTLFDVVSGFRQPAAGRVLLDGADITRKRPWERAELGLCRTFQASRLDLDQTVAENLLAGAYTMVPGNAVGAVLGTPASRRRMARAEEAARAIAELFDIEHYWSQPAGSLSFGNRRRVEIGRSIMAGPRVLLLDEPSAGLDPTASRILFSLVKRLQSDLGITLLLVEHNVRDLLENCDVVYALSRGTVIAVGAPDEVAQHPEVRSQYLGASFQLGV